MFHIGVATQHPPLPEPGQLSPTGIDFIAQCLTIDPVKRPTAVELGSHRWILDVQEALLTFDDGTDQPGVTSPKPALSMDEFQGVSALRQGKPQRQEEIQSSSATTPQTPPFTDSPMF